jgi:ATP-binding cassette subfamily C protein
LSKNLIVEVEQVAYGILVPLMTVLIEVSTLIGIFALLIYVEPLACCALILLFTVSGIAYSKIFSPFLHKLGQRRSDLKSEVFKMVAEALGGIKEIKVLGHEKFFESKFANNSETVQRVPAYLVELVAVLGLLLVVFVLLLQGNEGTTVVSALGLFVGASFRFVPSLNRILSSFHVLRLGRAPIEIVFEAIGDEHLESGVKEKIRFTKKLEFRNVSFSYNSQLAPVLKDISLDVSSGESLGIIGVSGAGKTTLVDLLLGLLTPASGQVLVDGMAVDLSQYSWRSEVGYVPQEIFLLDDTIRNNIALGISPREISDAKISQCLAIARLSDFVTSLPVGLNTVIGEKGVRLSGGQRQRIGIARAVYHQPSLLVLDEATSALDLETEREFVETLEALHKSVTMIVVSHRLSTLKYCDRKVRIAGGRLVSE